MTSHQPAAQNQRRHTFTAAQRRLGGQHSRPNFDYRSLILPPILQRLYAEDAS